MTELKLPEVNRVLLSGRLTRDPDGRFANDGTAITQLDLAFHRRYRSREGTASEQTGYVTVMTYQRMAEVCHQYLRKGSAVLIDVVLTHTANSGIDTHSRTHEALARSFSRMRRA